MEVPLGNRILVFYGSYRSDRMGIRLAQYVVERLRRRGNGVELIDAKAINLPMLDRMYKEYPKGEAPRPLKGSLARSAMPMGSCSSPANTTGRPARTEESNRSFPGGVVLAPRRDRELFGRTFVGWRGGDRLARHTLRDGNGGGLQHNCGWSIGQTLSAEAEPVGEGGQTLERAFPRFADDLAWWVDAAKAQRQSKPPPY